MSIITVLRVSPLGLPTTVKDPYLSYLLFFRKFVFHITYLDRTEHTQTEADNKRTGQDIVNIQIEQLALLVRLVEVLFGVFVCD